MQIPENEKLDGWKSLVVEGMQRDYGHDECRSFCEKYTKMGYIAGHGADADALIIAVREGNKVVPYMQIGPCMAIGPSLPECLEDYLKKVGRYAPGMPQRLLLQFMELVAQEFDNNQPYAILTMRVENSEKFRSFRAEFASNQMVGPNDLPKPPSYQPSLN
jgi:hypothetical protein